MRAAGTHLLGASPAAAERPSPLIRVRGLTRTFQRGEAAVHALRGVDLDVSPGEFLAIMGRSGSGKSTLLQLLGALDSPTTGSYELDGAALGAASSRQLSRIRAEKIGFVFQTFHLLDELSVLENVLLPFSYRSDSRRDARRQAEAAIHRVGLTDRRGHRANELSGGEMQRVAIARALAMAPRLILADEPTGNLDEETAHGILELLADLNSGGTTLVLVTHDRDVADRATRTLVMHDGRLQ